MLESVGSRELTEWMAYEQLNGPLSGQWTDDVLGSIGDLIQVTNRLIGAQAKKNPAPEPKRIPRPWELNNRGDA